MKVKLVEAADDQTLCEVELRPTMLDCHSSEVLFETNEYKLDLLPSFSVCVLT